MGGDCINKIKKILFRVTEADYNKIEKKAKKAKLNISQYISLSALDRDIVVFEDLKKLINQLSKAGNNLNQLTLLAHQNRLKEVNVKESLEVLKAIWEVLDKFTKK